MLNTTSALFLSHVTKNFLAVTLVAFALCQTVSLNAGDPRTDPRARAERNQAAEKEESAASKAKRLDPCSKCDQRHSDIRRTIEKQNRITISHLSSGAYLELIAHRCACSCHD